MNIFPTRKERFVIAGPTGSGKTKLAEQIVHRFNQTVIVDCKNDWNARPQDLVATDLFSLEKAMDKMREYDGLHVVYRVPREHLLPANSALLDTVARLCLERRDTFLYYDDVVFVATGSDFHKRAPHFYYCLTTGRSSGVAVGSCSQRPTWVPQVIFSESDYRATFYLRKQSDRARLEDCLGDEIPWQTLRVQKHSFVIGTDMETSPPLRLEFLPKEKIA